MGARHRLSRVRFSVFSEAMVPWLPIALGIGVLVGFLTYGFTLQLGGERPSFEIPVDAAHEYRSPEPTPTPEPTEEPPPPTESPPPVEDAHPPTTHPPTTHPPTTHPPTTDPPADPDIVGKYRVVESFSREFTAKVVIVNVSHKSQDWTVELEFPSTVGKLREYWVDGATQPTLSRSGDTYIFTGGAPVRARSKVVLKVQFAHSGGDIEPTVCTVNGTPCRR